MSICAINSISKRKDVFGTFCQETKKRQKADFAIIVLCNIWFNTINGTIEHTAKAVGRTTQGDHKGKKAASLTQNIALQSRASS